MSLNLKLNTFLKILAFVSIGYLKLLEKNSANRFADSCKLVDVRLSYDTKSGFTLFRLNELVYCQNLDKSYLAVSSIYFR